ncbi:hypothetical protein DPMN_140370 [Dreissena polymorpha]|uniref:Uncharacterized protein n=1 Tax=Dreissena polymorpha TaxID=45954 RepID=A0A9D4GDE2_DREPO|nr:hypothetical protein DPMN_140370 [Dreissena polymorpha]
MTVAFHQLLTLCNLLTCTLRHLHSALIHDLLSKVTDQVRVMGTHVARFMQVTVIVIT